VNDPRLHAALEVLRAHGLGEASITAEGPDDEIAALRVAPRHWQRLLAGEADALTAALLAAGFRYVALDLAAPAGDG
jgi:hypothetical protein